MEKKTYIIAGFAGVGKTTLAKKYDSVIDIESSCHKYDYSMYDNPDLEKLKGNKQRILNKNFPKNYVDAIYNATKKYKIVCVWCCEEALEIYKQYNLNVIVCYPDKQSFENYYIKRYISRGNSQEYINSAVSYYHKFVENFLEKSNYEKIVLHNSETLEQKLKQMKIL